MTRTPAEQLVDQVLAAQRAKGRAKYGTGLDHSDGHDWNHEALQELADAVQYLAAENVRLRAALRASTHDEAQAQGRHEGAIAARSDAVRAARAAGCTREQQRAIGAAVRLNPPPLSAGLPVDDEADARVDAWFAAQKP